MDEFMMSTKLIGILFVLIVLNIAAGTVASVLIEGDPFDKKFFVTGIIKAFVACIALIALAYVFGVVDLSALGFEPQTAISSGIAVYAAKLLRNVTKLIGIGKQKDELSELLSHFDGISKEEEKAAEHEIIESVTEIINNAIDSSDNATAEEEQAEEIVEQERQIELEADSKDSDIVSDEAVG